MYHNYIQERRKKVRIGGGREIGSVVGVVNTHQVFLIRSLHKPIAVVEITKTTLRPIFRIQWTLLKEKDDKIPALILGQSSLGYPPVYGKMSSKVEVA